MDEGHSTGYVFGVALVVALLAVGATLLGVWMYLNGKCAACKREGSGVGDDEIGVRSSRTGKSDMHTSLMD